MITEKQQVWPHFYENKPVRSNDKQGWESRAGQCKSRAQALTTMHMAADQVLKAGPSRAFSSGSKKPVKDVDYGNDKPPATEIYTGYSKASQYLRP